MQSATLVGGVLLATFAVARAHAEESILGPRCGQIEVLYVQDGRLHNAEVRKSSEANGFVVTWAELPSGGPEGEDRHAELVAVEVPQTVGESLLEAFDRLRLSSSTADYGYSSTPPLDGLHNYGAVRCDTQLVIGCGISEWALAAQNRDSLKIAWWVQLLKSTIWQWEQHRTPNAKRIIGSALREALSYVPVDFEMPVCGGKLAEWHGSSSINSGALLRSAIARGLVYGDLVPEPQAVPERDLRLATIERYSVDFKGNKLAKLLLPFLNDSEADVRFKAAYHLAGLLDPKRPQVRRALERYLSSETDPMRRHWVENAMTEMDKAGRKVQATPTF